MNILDLLFPKRCVGCGRVGRYICDRCAKTIIPIAPNESICPVCERPAIGGVTHPRCRTRYTPDGLTSFFRYRGVVRWAIHAIKYRFVSDMSTEFVNLVDLTRWDRSFLVIRRRPILVPVPVHAARLRERGFNQAERLGRVFARRLAIERVSDFLIRSAPTRPQVDMQNKKERLANMRRVFTVNRSALNRFVGRPAFLFDDVFTTGATIRDASWTLKAAGVRQVWAVTMAR